MTLTRMEDILMVCFGGARGKFVYAFCYVGVCMDSEIVKNTVNHMRQAEVRYLYIRATCVNRSHPWTLKVTPLRHLRNMIRICDTWIHRFSAIRTSNLRLDS